MPEPPAGEFIPRGGAEPVRPAVVVHSWNPLRRDIRRHETVEIGTRIRDLVPDTTLPYICVFNGDPLLRKDWDRRVMPGDVVGFQVLPQGGGGDGGSNPLQIILGIVLIVVGYFTFGATTQIGAGLIAAGIGSIAAGVLAALAPSPRNSGAVGGGYDSASPSPSYSVSLRGNAARLSQPVPVLYGRMQIFPDYAAPPYYIYDENEQMLAAVFCLGHGHFDIEAIRLDDTALENLDGVSSGIYTPGMTLPDTILHTVPFIGKAARIISAPVNVVTAVEVAGQPLDDGSYLGPYVGPFIVSPSDQQVDQIYVDIVWPRGLFLADTTNGNLGSMTTYWVVEAQQIDEYDFPVGAVNDWTVLGAESYTDATSTPVRRTYIYPVTPGRYQIRARRTAERNSNSNASNDMVWAALRATLAVPAPSLSDVTYVAVLIKASNQLSQLSQRRFNVIATRKIPTWSPQTGWTAPVATRSIAWALADALKNPTYGAGLDDSRIDLAKLYELEQLWVERGDRFNAVFDSRITLWEALSQIARAGRAAVTLQAGVVTVVRDQAQTLPTALYSMRNIKRGSFGVQYSVPTEEAPDAITLEYFDEKMWLPRQVTEIVPGGSGLKPAKLQLFGVTSQLHARREARFLAANNYYRRRVIRFEVEMDGFIPSYGDLVAIAHDLPAWGVSGEVTAYDDETRTLTLTEPVNFDGTAGAHYVIFTASTGRVIGPHACVSGGQPDRLTLLELPDEEPYTGSDMERGRFSFGPGQSWGQLARILSIRPRTMESVELTCIAEDDRVHAADTDLLTGANTPRYGLLAPDDIPDYSTATVAQRAKYAFYADNGNFVGVRDEAAYLFQE